MDHLRPTATLGAGVVVLRDSHVLLTQMNYGPFKGHWILPGGKLELSETPEEAALREVFEETGIHVQLSGLVAVRFRARNRSQNSGGAPHQSDLPDDVYWVFLGTMLDPTQEPVWPEEELLQAKFWSLKELRDPNLNSSVRPLTRSMIELATKTTSQVISKQPLPEGHTECDTVWGN